MGRITRSSRWPMRLILGHGLFDLCRLLELVGPNRGPNHSYTSRLCARFRRLSSRRSNSKSEIRWRRSASPSVSGRRSPPPVTTEDRTDWPIGEWTTTPSRFARLWAPRSPAHLIPSVRFRF